MWNSCRKPIIQSWLLLYFQTEFVVIPHLCSFIWEFLFFLLFFFFFFCLQTPTSQWLNTISPSRLALMKTEYFGAAASSSPSRDGRQALPRPPAMLGFTTAMRPLGARAHLHQACREEKLRIARGETAVTPGNGSAASARSPCAKLVFASRVEKNLEANLNSEFSQGVLEPVF